jgi:hypothetical protein
MHRDRAIEQPSMSSQTGWVHLGGKTDEQFESERNSYTTVEVMLEVVGP